MLARRCPSQEDNGDLDISSTEAFQRDNILHFLCYWARFVFLGGVELPLYCVKKKRWELLAKVVSGVVRTSMVPQLGLACPGASVALDLGASTNRHPDATRDCWCFRDSRLALQLTVLHCWFQRRQHGSLSFHSCTAGGPSRHSGALCFHSSSPLSSSCLATGEAVHYIAAS